MEITIKLEGPTHFLESDAGIMKALNNLITKSTSQIREHILAELSRSVELSTYASNAPDPEAVKTIIRSVHVVPDIPPSTNILIKYGDEYAHLYGGESDQEINQVITDIVGKAINGWFNSQQAITLFSDAMMENI